MEYIHIRNLEKYHPGYKDRVLQWAKVYINMANGDPETELLDEIDFSRLIKLILLEIRAQKPLPLKNDYFQSKGFNLKKRPMSLTIEMLHNFIVIVTEDEKLCYVEEEEEEEKDKEKEEDRRAAVTDVLVPYQQFEDFCFKSWNTLCSEYPVLSKVQEISGKRREKLKKRFVNKSFHAFDAILIAIKNQSFLLGENDRKWRVSFDWIIENDTNYLKVLENKYLSHDTESDHVKLKEKYKL